MTVKKIIEKAIEKKIKNLGFIKTEESDLFVGYERKDNKYGYTQKVDLLHKKNTKNIMQSYDSANEHMCGLSAEEAIVFAVKMWAKW